jgi:hypothetical protein
MTAQLIKAEICVASTIISLGHHQLADVAASVSFTPDNRER